MIFLGILFNRDDEKKIKEKSVNGCLQNQVNAFQWNCIDGIYEVLRSGIKIINVLPVGIFPFQYRDLYLKSGNWNYNGEMHHEVGSINIPFLKQYFRALKISRILKKAKDTEIVVYTTYLPFLKAVRNLDNHYNITLIVTDLPEYYDYSSNTGNIKKFFRKMNNKKIYKCLERIDRFVLLTEQMKDRLNVGNRPYTIVEGICKNLNSNQSNVSAVNNGKKIILYTGTLNRRFGIDVLVKAFSLIKDGDYELWFCGGGDYENEIKTKADADKRIVFFGYISKKEVEEKQQIASVLVNPRQNIGEYTKYSFPSKTMEYLASGKPVVAYKLDGIPDEYDDYLNYVEDNTPEALCRKLKEVCEDTTGVYMKKACSAIDFLMKHKSPSAQAKKIISISE